MRSVAYTNHIGRTSRDKHSGKNTAIRNLADLAAAEKHNNHDYTPEEVARMQSDIDLDLKGYNSQYVMIAGNLVPVVGHINLEENVRRIYEEQFGAAVDEYNRKQIAAGHPGRQIQSYIDKVSDAKQQEVAVEGLIQFGSLEDWKGKSMEEKQKMVPLLLKSLEYTMAELKQEDAEFILAGASIHLNEGSPHLHYVGVPVQTVQEPQKGLRKRNKKIAVFNQETLGTGLQDNVRAKIEPQLMETFGWEFEKKKAGRNEDLTKNQIANEKLQERLVEIKYVISQTQNDLGDRLQKFGDDRINEVLADSDTFENILFLVAECDADRLLELEQEGLELKEKMLRDAFAHSQDPVREGLDRVIDAINSDKARALTWQQRQAKWEEYQEVSEKFWKYRKEMQEYMNDLYRQRQDIKRMYYDTRYCIDENESLLECLLRTSFLLYDLHKMNQIQKEIDNVKSMQREMKQNTSRFSKFSRRYREDLKAGKMPSDRTMEAMAAIVLELDKEHEKFCLRNKEKTKEKGQDVSR